MISLYTVIHVLKAQSNLQLTKGEFIINVNITHKDEHHACTYLVKVYEHYPTGVQMPLNQAPKDPPPRYLQDKHHRDLSQGS